MADPSSAGKLPGNHGQFGRNIATEEYKPLDNHEGEGRAPSPGSPAGREGAPRAPGPVPGPERGKDHGNAG